ncbi:hypothetical protein [Vibrio crassostreae]|uniref:hypothetical protein n=1 Tax=Vibrio crassostreae TaxID=246167 RepID=UPI00104558D3|nr:hypothetical protein [Vibrio crassostreae]TCN91554.1 hypothetical protein EDB51_1349 [Vibrio crassostreae]CAK2016801.1 Outer membrane protein [Vibrio crassostreae]CAK2022712.1 Outer membrane protein [Vibrio crassostreae]CAK2058038.1 Outer membrane protein [Vibrio crassostreae]CAK2066179.1 Outer membrane protein [Vibrio crassostreae]
MNTTFKYTALSLVLAATHTFAAEEDINPSDMTRTFTSFGLGMANNGNAKLSGQISTSLENTELMSTIDLTLDKDGDYSDGRFQYYHVFSVDNETTPRVAVSLDIIDNALFSTGNIGLATVFKTGIKGFDIYARAGYVAGEYSEDFGSSLSINDKSMQGGMGGLYFTYVMENGMYLQYFPEYMGVVGDADFTNIKNTVQFGAPVNDSKNIWLMTKFENINNSWESNGVKESDSDNIVWATAKFYF